MEALESAFVRLRAGPPLTSAMGDRPRAGVETRDHGLASLRLPSWAFDNITMVPI